MRFGLGPEQGARRPPSAESAQSRFASAAASRVAALASSEAVRTLATAALPDRPQGRPDLADAPRRALVAVFQLATVVLVALLVIAVTQPFVPGVPGAVVLLVLLAVLGLAFWRSAKQLQGHLRAGAQAIVEALAKGASAHKGHESDALAGMRALLPGLGEPVAVRVAEQSPGIGRTLASINLRGLTGATVLAISRPGGGVMVPSAQEVLRAGDILALAGTKEAVEAARALLEAPATVEQGRQADERMEGTEQG